MKILMMSALMNVYGFSLRTTNVNQPDMQISRASRMATC